MKAIVTGGAGFIGSNLVDRGHGFHGRNTGTHPPVLCGEGHSR